jgi:hypothetical protein
MLEVWVEKSRLNPTFHDVESLVEKGSTHVVEHQKSELNFYSHTTFVCLFGSSPPFVV